MKPFVQNTLLLSAGILAALLLGEGLIRLSGRAPQIAYIEKWRMRLASNPKIGWEPIPYLNTDGKSYQYYGYEGTSNSLGFRDREHAIGKTPGTYRIVVLGDSVADGLWVKDANDTFPARLERFLNEHGVAAEVLNFSVSGYNTLQEVETLKDKALAFNPDLVILAYCLNDRKSDSGNIYGFLMEKKKKLAGIDRAQASSWIYRSALVRFMKFNVWDRLLPTPEKAAGSDVFAQDTVEESFQKLAELSRQHHFQVLAVLFPELSAIDTQKTDNLFWREHQAIQGLSLSHQFQFIDLWPALATCKARSPAELIGFDQYHLRPLGHACAAEDAGRHILQNISVQK